MAKQRFSKMITVETTQPWEGQIKCVDQHINCKECVLAFNNKSYDIGSCVRMNLCEMLKEVKHNG